MRRGIFAVGLGLLLAMSTGPALAQTSPTYQPGACSGTTNLGSTAVGGTITGTLGPGCQFTGPLTMTVNGASGGTKTGNAPPGGGVNVVIQVTSATQGLLNDPVQVPIKIGANDISATGQTAQGTATVRGTFTVTAQGATTVPGAAPAAPASRVAFTGANILRWSLAAAALAGIGVLMVWGSRRRRSMLER